MFIINKNVCIMSKNWEFMLQEVDADFPLHHNRGIFFFFCPEYAKTQTVQRHTGVFLPQSFRSCVRQNRLSPVCETCTWRHARARRPSHWHAISDGCSQVSISMQGTVAKRPDSSSVSRKKKNTLSWFNPNQIMNHFSILIHPSLEAQI